VIRDVSGTIESVQRDRDNHRRAALMAPTGLGETIDRRNTYVSDDHFGDALYVGGMAPGGISLSLLSVS
jgi:hypothetical protein